MSEDRDKIYEMIISNIKSVYDEDDKFFKLFMNPGIIEKKIIKEFELQNSLTDLEKEMTFRASLHNIIVECFSYININKNIKFIFSNKYLEKSYTELENNILNIQNKISKQNGLLSQINKSRYLFYGNKHYQLIDDKFTNIKGETYINGIEKVFIPLLEDIFITSGPIIDLNSIDIAYDNQNPTFDGIKIQLQIPIAKNYVIKLNSVEEDNYYLRKMKLNKLIYKL